jgi:hypothetical protein
LLLPYAFRCHPERRAARFFFRSPFLEYGERYRPQSKDLSSRAIPPTRSKLRGILRSALDDANGKCNNNGKAIGNNGSGFFARNTRPQSR